MAVLAECGKAGAPAALTQAGHHIRAAGLLTVLNILIFVQLLAGLFASLSTAARTAAQSVVKKGARAISRVFGIVSDMQLALRLGREIQALANNSVFTNCLEMCLRIAAAGADYRQVLDVWRLLKSFDILLTPCSSTTWQSSLRSLRLRTLGRVKPSWSPFRACTTFTTRSTPSLAKS